MRMLPLAAWLLVGVLAWSVAGRSLARRRPCSSPIFWVAPAVAGGAAVTTLSQLDQTHVAFDGVAVRAAVFWIAGSLVFALVALLPAGPVVRSRWLIIATGLGLQLLGLVTGGNDAGKISVHFPLAGSVVVTDLTRLALIVFTAATVWRLEPLLDQSLRRRCMRPLLAVATCWAASAAMSMAAADTGAVALTIGVLAVFAYLVFGRPGPTATLAAGGVLAVGTAVVVFPHAIRRVTSFLAPPSGDRIAQGQMALFASSSGRMFGSPRGGEGLQFVGSTLDDDFLLAAVGRVLGLCGVVAVILLVALAATACVRPALEGAPSGFGTWVGLGAAVALVLQLVLAAGGVFGLVPATGVPLPMMTGSGASLMATYALLGMAAGRRPQRVVAKGEHPIDLEVTQ